MASNDYKPEILIGGVYFTSDVLSYQIEIGRRGAGDTFDPPNARITFNGQQTFNQLDDVEIYCWSGANTHIRFRGWVTDTDTDQYTTTIIAVSQTYTLMNNRYVGNALSPRTNYTPVQLLQVGDPYATGSGVPTPTFVYRNTANWFSTNQIATASWASTDYTVAAWFSKWTGCLPDSRWYIDQEDRVIFENGNWRSDPVNNPTLTFQAGWVSQAVTSSTNLNDRSGQTYLYIGANGDSLSTTASSSHPRFLYNIPTKSIITYWIVAPTGTSTWVQHAQAVNDDIENTRLSSFEVPVQHLSTADAKKILNDYRISSVIDSSAITALLPVAGDLIVEGWTESYRDDGYWSVNFWMSYATLTRQPEEWQNVTTTTQWSQVSNTITWDSMLTDWI